MKRRQHQQRISVIVVCLFLFVHLSIPINAQSVNTDTQEIFQRNYLYSAIFVLVVLVLFAVLLIRRYQQLSQRLELRVQKRTEELHELNNKLYEANQILQKISMIDPLTSVQNRRSFDNKLSEAWKMSEVMNSPLSILMIDLDNFKIFNDTYGHLQGDKVLIKIAEQIKEIVSKSDDVVSRFGGEEFVCLLTNTTNHTARDIAENIRQSIEALHIENKGVNTIMTISCGISTTIAQASIDPYSLIHEADIALYRAKEKGNVVVSF